VVVVVVVVVEVIHPAIGHVEVRSHRPCFCCSNEIVLRKHYEFHNWLTEYYMRYNNKFVLYLKMQIFWVEKVQTLE